jgi:transposase
VKSSSERKVESGSLENVSNFSLAKPGKTGSREKVSRAPNELRSLGRPNCLSEDKLQELLDVYYSRPYSLRKLADMFGVSRMTVWRAVQQFTFSEVSS